MAVATMTRSWLQTQRHTLSSNVLVLVLVLVFCVGLLIPASSPLCVMCCREEPGALEARRIVAGGAVSKVRTTAPNLPTAAAQ